MGATIRLFLSWWGPILMGLRGGKGAHFIRGAIGDKVKFHTRDLRVASLQQMSRHRINSPNYLP